MATTTLLFVALNFIKGIRNGYTIRDKYTKNSKYLININQKNKKMEWTLYISLVDKFQLVSVIRQICHNTQKNKTDGRTYLFSTTDGIKSNMTANSD